MAKVTRRGRDTTATRSTDDGETPARYFCEGYLTALAGFREQDARSTTGALAWLTQQLTDPRAAAAQAWETWRARWGL